MNEGENSSMPQSPNFSSPNISSNGDTQPSFPTNTEPIQPAITSTDVAAMSGTGAGAVAAAAAALPENDAPTTISSTPSAPISSTQRSRFNFGANRFHAKEPQSTAPTFAGAPDYFNQAAGDIYLENQYQENKNSKKKLIIAIAVGVAVVVIGVIGVISLMGGGGIGGGKVLTAEDAKDKFNRDDALAAFDLDREIAKIYRGEEKDEVLFSETYYKMMTDGYKAYAKIAEALKGYGDIEGEDSLGRDKKVKKVADNMQKNQSVYKELVDKYKVIYSAKSEGVSKLDELSDNTSKTEAKKYIAAVTGYDDFIKNRYNANGCNVEPDDMTTYPTICRTISDELNEYEKNISMTGEKMKNIIIGDTDVSSAMNRLIGDDLIDVMAYLGELWTKQ